MKLNIDEIVEKAVPWDLRITIRDKDYTFLRPSPEQLRLLDPCSQAGPEERLHAILGCFAEPRPDFQLLDADIIVAVVCVFAAYLSERIKSSLKKIHPVIKAELDRQFAAEAKA